MDGQLRDLELESSGEEEGEGGEGPGRSVLSSAGFRIRIHLIRIRIQQFRAEYRSGSRVFMTKNWKKFTAGKYFFLLKQKLQFPYLGLHKGRPSYKRSLKLSKENIQHLKT
jgi:hypothetical protein